MEKIRIAFFAENLFEETDGASRTMFQLINRIPKDQFEFCFVYGDGPTEIPGYTSIRVPTFTIPANKSYSLSIPSLIRNKLIQKLDAFDVDVVHIATPSLLGHFALDYAESRALRSISIYHTHFISYIGYYFKSLPFLIKPIEQLIAAKQRDFYNRCHTIYVPTTGMSRSLRDQGVHAEQLQIWPRGIDRGLFHPEKRDPRWLHEATGNDWPTILFASRLVWEKNLDCLFQIYRHLRTRNIPVNFVVAGDGQAKNACKKAMPDALFMGHLGHESLSTLYASSDIFLFPSISETYGNVVAEAMASGLPCVVSDQGGPSELVENGETGFVCRGNDPGDFLRAILSLLESPSLLKKFRQAGLERSKSRDWQQLADNYFEDLRFMHALKASYKMIS